MFVNLLCDALQPIGHYRREYVKHSRGKSDTRDNRSKRRAIQHKLGQRPQEDILIEESDAAADPVTPSPEIFSSVTIGFNTTVRYLEALSTANKQLAVEKSANDDIEGFTATFPIPFAAVFVCRESLPALLTSSMPSSVAAASLAHPDEPATRLVPLGQASEQRLAKALHQPKVGFIGVKQGCPGLIGLMALVQEKVAAIDVPWLRQARAGAYLPLNVLETEVSIGPKRPKDPKQRRRVKKLERGRKKPASGKA